MKNRNKILLKILSNHLDIHSLDKKNEDLIGSIIKLNNELITDAPRFKQIVNKTFFENATMGAAIYISIKEHIKEGSLEIVNSIFDEFFRKSVEKSKITLFVFSIMHKIPFIGEIITFLLTRPNENGGWIAKKGLPGALISVDITSCGLNNYYKKLGIDELCIVFCNGDHINAEYMTGLEFKREETIALGNESCKFRYYKKDILKSHST